jgi:AraC-like DNA-binding protein
MDCVIENEVGNAAQPNPIAELLRRRVIPWIERDGTARVIVARSQMQDVQLPDGAKIHRKKRVGKRVVARGTPRGEAPRVIAASWPADDQIELRIPQLLCVVGGNADIHLSNYVLQCPQGTFVFIPPGVAKPSGVDKPHLEGEVGSASFCEILWFSPHRRWMQMWVCRSRAHSHESGAFHENVLTTDGLPGQLLEALWEGLTDESQKCGELHDALLKSLMLSLENNLLRERFLYLSADDPDTVIAGNAALQSPHDPIAYACEYIGNRLHENLTLEKVARKVYMSRAGFARRFRAESGVTFTQFTTRLRMEQAQRLLQETDYSIAYICRLVGYKSTTHLYNLFARQHGSTPIEFRRRALKNTTVES